MRSTLCQLLFVASVACGVWCPLEVSAGIGQLLVAPDRYLSPKDDLLIVVDTNWVDSPGYRPVRIRIETLAKKPAATEREFELRFKAESDKTKLVSGQLTLQQGGIACETFLLVPQDNNGLGNHRIEIECFENGRRLDYLNVVMGHRRYGQSTFETQALPVGLFIDNRAPTFTDRRFVRRGEKPPSWRGQQTPFGQIGPLIGRYTSRYLSDQSTNAIVVDLLQANPHCSLIHPQDLPTNWLAYSCFDLVYMTAAQLGEFKSNYPEAFSAMLDWLATGGSLVVVDGGKEFQQLGQVASELELPGTQTETTWAAVDRELLYKEFTPSHRWRRSSDRRRDEGQPPEFWDKIAEVRSESYVMGKVLVIGSDNAWREPGETWDVVFNSIADDHGRWRERHGFLVAEPEMRFYQFLIPGVGLPPVGTFRVLIAIFVVFIGPVCYIVLMRQRRLYLMMAIIPLTAAGICLGLVTYAFLSDGVGTKARINSYAEIDHRTGRLATWTRQSYYAGVAPSEGMVYNDDTAIYPIVNEIPAFSTYSTQWETDQQRLTQGNIGSRMTSQFLTVQSGPADIGLDVETAPSGSGPGLKVTNRFGGKLLAVALVDADGNAFHASEIESDAEFVPAPVESAQVAPIIRPFILSGQPRYPDGLDTTSQDGNRNYIRSLSRFVDYNYDNKGMLDWKYDEILQGSATEFMKPRSYLAVLDLGTQQLCGVESPEIISGLCVVRGTW